MSRRRDYLTFFANRRGRGEFLFAHDGVARLRWILPAILVAAPGRPGRVVVQPAGARSRPPRRRRDHRAHHPPSDQHDHHRRRRDGGSVPDDRRREPTGAPSRATPSAPGASTPRSSPPRRSSGRPRWGSRAGSTTRWWWMTPSTSPAPATRSSSPTRPMGCTPSIWPTGTRRWFFAGSLDVNGVAANDDIVVATGDEGLVWGIDPDEGLALWTANLGVAVFSNPLLVDGKAIVGDGSGTVSAFDLGHGAAAVARAPWPGRCAAGRPSTASRSTWWARRARSRLSTWTAGSSGARRSPPAPGRGTSCGCSPLRSSPGTCWWCRWSARTSSASRAWWPSTAPREMWCGRPPTPPASSRSGAACAPPPPWSATCWCTARATPTAWWPLGIADGQTKWSAEVGPLCYPHWSSPAVVSGLVILPRFDGGLYAVDLATQALAWSMYLGLEATGRRLPGRLRRRRLLRVGAADRVLGHRLPGGGGQRSGAGGQPGGLPLRHRGHRLVTRAEPPTSRPP